MLRDVLCGQIPLVLRSEVYAAASMIGAAVFLILQQFTEKPGATMLISALVILTIRLLAIKYKVSLPTFRFHKATGNEQAQKSR